MLESKDGTMANGTETKAAQVKDSAPVKAYLTTYTKVKAADLNKQAWVKPEDIIASAVKLHGGMVEGYRNSGLG